MEFLSFDGDDQEDSGDREIPNSNTNDGDEEAMEDKENKPMSKKDNNTNPKESNNARRLLKKAQERRERARIFSHFASRFQNLQRVWAPKQQSKETRSMCKNSINNKLGKRRRRNSRNDMVLETPMKMLHSAEEEEQGVQVCKPSFKRTLFLDEDQSNSQCD